MKVILRCVLVSVLLLNVGCWYQYQKQPLPNHRVAPPIEDVFGQPRMIYLIKGEPCLQPAGAQCDAYAPEDYYPLELLLGPNAPAVVSIYEDNEGELPKFMELMAVGYPRGEATSVYWQPFASLREYETFRKRKPKNVVFVQVDSITQRVNLINVTLITLGLVPSNYSISINYAVEAFDPDGAKIVEFEDEQAYQGGWFGLVFLFWGPAISDEQNERYLLRHLQDALRAGYETE